MSLYTSIFYRSFLAFARGWVDGRSCLTYKLSIKEFQYITQSYSLTFHDTYMILTNNLFPEEHKQVWEQVKIHADKIHQTNAARPPRAKVVPDRWRPTMRL